MLLHELASCIAASESNKSNGQDTPLCMTSQGVMYSDVWGVMHSEVLGVMHSDVWGVMHSEVLGVMHSDVWGVMHSEVSCPGESCRVPTIRLVVNTK